MIYYTKPHIFKWEKRLNISTILAIGDTRMSGYGNQFRKMLRFICRPAITLLATGTVKDKNGERIDCFSEKPYIKNLVNKELFWKHIELYGEILIIQQKSIYKHIISE